jgi:hypothetical protein
MSQTNVPINPAIMQAGPVAAPGRPRERRVRFGHLALAIALIVVGALGTATLVFAVTAEGTYLVAARDIGYGARFTEADLTTVRLNSAPEISPIRADQLDQVIGNYAAMPLAEGTLLVGKHVTNEEFPGPGQVRLGLTLPANRLPGRQVQPGDLVRLVDTTDPATGGGEETSPAAPQSWQGTVVRVEDAGRGDFLGSGSGETTVDVVVSEREADIIARLAANDNIYLTVLPGE